MSELQRTIEALGSSFEAFKAENDARLKEVEQKGHADPLLNEKVDKINAELTSLTNLKARLDDIEAAANRPDFGGAKDVDKAKAEHKQAFDTFFRKGVEDGLRDLEIKAALSTGVDADGGFTVPDEEEQAIDRVLGSVSAMRRLARVQPVGSATYKKLVNQGGTASGWVGETGARTETGAPSLVELAFPTMELYANPAATQSMLDDTRLNTGEWLAGEVATEFAEQEGAAFITGDGISKPTGILGYTAVANASYTWGNVGYVASGAAGDFVDPGNKLIDLVHALKSGYRANASWLMNDLTLAEVRKIKDGQGAYIWRPGIEAGAPETLLGKPVGIDDNMPDIAANSLSIAFADFNRAYMITDRVGIRVLRDPFTNKPYVHFYTTKRVGGGMQNFEAIKLMRFSL